jgi:hypothetical protein
MFLALVGKVQPVDTPGLFQKAGSAIATKISEDGTQLFQMMEVFQGEPVADSVRRGSECRKYRAPVLHRFQRKTFTLFQFGQHTVRFVGIAHGFELNSSLKNKEEIFTGHAGLKHYGITRQLDLLNTFGKPGDMCFCHAIEWTPPAYFSN